MKTANEIEQAIKTINYHAGKIEELTDMQLNADFSLQNINTQVGSVRFDSLGAIGAASKWIKVYCQNMSKNLESATLQDKILHSEDTS